MDAKKAWENMNSDTKSLVVELYVRYCTNRDRQILEEIRNIFENHGDEKPSERELERLLG